MDDMLDTGETLVSASEKLKAAGVREIRILVTHGLFTGSSWRHLWSLGVKQIICTDTIRSRAGIAATEVTVLSVGPLIAKGLSWLDQTDGKRAFRI